MSREKLDITVNEVMSVRFPFVTEKMIFLNTAKTACLSIGKTRLNGSIMLYVYAKIWNGSSWYIDNMIVCRNSKDIITMLSAWIRQHTDRRFA